MSAQFAKDGYGREIISAPHFSNCWLFALEARHQHGGRVRLRWSGCLPHLVVESHDGVREFVYGKHGRNALFPILFKGYGVRVRSE